jgi:hypothetical protein
VSGLRESSESNYLSDNAPEELGETRILANRGFHKKYKEDFNVYLTKDDFAIINIPDSSPFTDKRWQEQREFVDEIKNNLGEVKEGITMPYWGTLPLYTIKERKIRPSEKVSIIVTSLYKGKNLYLAYTDSSEKGDRDVIRINDSGGHVKRQNIGIGIKDGRSANLVTYLQEWERGARTRDAKSMKESWRKIQNGYHGIYNYSNQPGIPPHLAIAIKASQIEYITPH